jgi:uncharacterized membrane protein
LGPLWNTYFTTQGDSIARSFIGTFGWGDTSLPEFIVIVGYIGLFIIIIANSYRKVPGWISKRQKLLIGAVWIAYLVAVGAALYAYFNAVASKVIAGIQGRYFLPLAFLSIPLLHGGWLKISERAYKNIAVLMPIFLLSVSVITIYFRYYVK